MIFVAPALIIAREQSKLLKIANWLRVESQEGMSFRDAQNFTQSPVSRDYYAEAQQERNLAAKQSSSSSASPRSAWLKCPSCADRMKSSFAMRELFRDVKKFELEGVIMCEQCKASAFSSRDVGLHKKVHYCRTCEIAYCPTCAPVLMLKQQQ